MLTDAKIRKIKPELTTKRYTDEKGMYLEVTPKGGMYWRMKYRIGGKENRYSIGTYPAITLAEARKRRDEARQQVEQGIDPNQAKQQAKRELEGADTFEYVAREWHTKKSTQWASSTVVKLLRRLEMDIFPYIGKQPIAAVTAPDLLRVIQRIESRSIDTAYRALQECGQIFRYGMATGRNIHDPSTALKGALSPRPERHFAAITEPHELAKLLKAIESFNGTFVVKCALQLAPMFFTRIGELRTARWADIDLDAAEWRFYITKTKQDHIVTLPTQAVAILRDLQQLTGSFEYVFYGARDRRKPMSDAAINASLRRMGYDTKTEITGHGFRATARTILHERLGFERDVIEHQLAHSVGDALGTAYNRTKFLEQRRTMMQAWADYLEGLRTDSNVIPFGRITA